MQLPILGAYRTRLSDEFNLTLKAGPYFAYALSGDDEWSDSDGDSGSIDIFSSDFEGEGVEASRFDFGLALGADVEYHRFVVGVEAEFGFIPFVKNTEDNMKIRNISAYITVGYKF
ncbi:MAG: outer membrane beta-barrel protein [Bacteroides sp.]|nr:outer membrane beta-barrel protein [Bacteroides sp.]